VVLLFLAWRLALSLVAGVSLWYNRVLYPYGKLLSWNGSLLDRTRIVRRALIDGWSLWDSDYYTAIALHGYTFRNVEWPSIPFFPLYPLLIRLILPLCGGDVALAAALIANSAFALALVFLDQLLRIDFGVVLATRTILVLLAFPMSLFFAASYTESLALALTVLVVWALRRQYWWLAGIAGFFLALTRLPGILAAPIILLIYLERQQWRWQKLRCLRLHCPC
jgi:Gpi18-like mannosyltransferase